MKILIGVAVVALLVVVAVAVSVAYAPDDLDRAISAHEAIEGEEIGKYAAMVGMTGRELAAIRHENVRKQLIGAPRVGEVVRVHISRTMDTKTYVLQLEFSNGKQYSLWLDAGVSAEESSSHAVRSITAY